MLARWAELDPKTRTITAIARACGCSRMAVYKWLQQKTRPRAEHRSVLRHLAAIPEDAWLTAEERRSLRAAIAAA